MRFGAGTGPLAGWLTGAQPAASFTELRLAAIRRLVEGYGLAAVEISLDQAVIFPQAANDGFFSGVARLQQELGFSCSVHLPFLWLDLSSGNERVRQASVDTIRQAIALVQAQPIRVSGYVLHLCGSATQGIASRPGNSLRRDALLDVIRAQASRSLDQVATLVPRRDLCVETLEAPAWDLFEPTVEEHGVSLCLDVGHLVWLDLDAKAFYRQHAQRIREIHLHDVRTVGEGELRQFRDHLALGLGGLDYAGFLRLLEAEDFQGTVILEVHTKEALDRSLAAVRPFLDRHTRLQGDSS